MLIAARCLIFLEFLSRMMIISSSNSSTESRRPISTGRLRKIPRESIDWNKQREGGYLYADKTVYLERILDNLEGNKFFYITRPRRFGKTSFLMAMAKHFFNGNRKLFQGLQIGNRGNTHFFKKPEDGGVPKELKHRKWIQCPLIYLDFCSFPKFETSDEFTAFFNQQLRDIARFYRVDYLKHSPLISISSLISELHFEFKVKVVVLVDEYDWPFHYALENLKNKALANEIRLFLDVLFGNIKSMIDHMRLALIVGVSRLGLPTLQSGPNNYVDLTYKEAFAGAFGFTSEEIKGFEPEIAHKFNLNNKEGIDKFLVKLRQEYDGYNFSFQYTGGKKMNVLNPVSTMKCLENKKFGYYWSETSNVNEVIRKLFFSRESLKVFEHRKLSREAIERKRNSATEIIPLDILMLIYGYLTIESYNDETKDVVPNFPNNEIVTALQNNINNYETTRDDFLSEEYGWLIELKWHMEMGSLEGTMNILMKMLTTKLSSTFQQGMNKYSNAVRLMEKLQMADIPYSETVEFKKENFTDTAGDENVQTICTIDLKVNFIMSMKYDGSGTLALKVLINYFRTNITTFRDAINTPVEAQLAC